MTVSDKNSLLKHNIISYLDSHQNKPLLRFITCGSVDDGKSTLIGRLLYDCQTIFDDQLHQLKSDSKRLGTQGNSIDFALLVDGLAAEQEQGITIDVAYRFFSTENRKFIVADTPGHEQYTRNMITGASTAELAVILVDARKGILKQTRRHAYICNLLGIKDLVLAVNKMDLVNYEKDIFDKIVGNFHSFTKALGINNFVPIPVSGHKGANIANQSNELAWYTGPTLLKYLETVKITQNGSHERFSMPVQWVNRPNMDFRGFAGKIISGHVKPGDEVSILPSGKSTRVSKIISYDRNLETASVGQSITLTLEDEIDCSRGEIISSRISPLEIADQFECTIIWMNEEDLVAGRTYLLKIGSKTIAATIAEPKYKINTSTLEKIATKTLEMNEIGVATLTCEKAIPFSSYSENRALGGFIIIDKMTNNTVGAGLINFGLRRSQNIHWQKMDVGKTHHAKIKNQKPVVIWMTGISGSGKSTIANALENRLAQMNYHTFLLDGDNIRHGLNKDLGFTDADRIENIRRIGEVSKLMTDAGLIVITAFISPFQSERDMVKAMIEENEFIEVFIDTPLKIAEKRDVKGLYAKARSGQLKNFTGLDSLYEEPKNPDIRIETTRMTVDDSVEIILEKFLKFQN